MIYIFFGPPGSGKGTQAAMLAKQLKLPAISTGELFRAEQDKKTALGKMVSDVLANGKLVKDEVIERILAKRLRESDAQKGFILDGYPRNKKQLTWLIEQLYPRAKNFGAGARAILIKVGDSEVKKRLSGRRTCVCGASYHLKFNPPRRDKICDLCGGKLEIRNDDKPAIIKKRLAVYHKEIGPVIDYWKKRERLIEINGEQKIEKVQSDVFVSLRAKRSNL